MECNLPRISWTCLTITKHKHLINLLALRMFSYTIMSTYMFNIAQSFLEFWSLKSLAVWLVYRKKTNISQYHYTKYRSNKSRYRLVVAEEAVLTKNMALMPPSQYFAIISKYFDTQFRVFNFNPKTKFTYIYKLSQSLVIKSF